MCVCIVSLTYMRGCVRHAPVPACGWGGVLLPGAAKHSGCCNVACKAVDTMLLSRKAHDRFNVANCVLLKKRVTVQCELILDFFSISLLGFVPHSSRQMRIPCGPLFC